MPDYIIGVDLGQAHDYTAISVLERHTRETGRTMPTAKARPVWGRETQPRPQTESTYQVRHLERLKLGTPYPDQVARVLAVIEQVKTVQAGSGTPAIVVDQTGVGRPVVDMLTKAGVRGLAAVSIHGGDATSRDGREYRVPKRELVSILQVLLQSDRLTVAGALPEAQTLTRELLAFKVTFSARGHDTYGNDWRENDHDDMVLSVALAAWAGETGVGRQHQFAFVGSRVYSNTR